MNYFTDDDKNIYDINPLGLDDLNNIDFLRSIALNILHRASSNFQRRSSMAS